MICANCKKNLKPFCDTKIEDGKTYCVQCYWNLFGRERILKALDKIHTRPTDPEQLLPPSGCLKMDGIK